MPPDKPPEKDSIDYLRRELYAREEPAEIKGRVESLSQLGKVKPKEVAPSGATVSAGRFENIMLKRTAQRRVLLRWSLLGLGAVAAVGLIIGGTWWYRSAHQVTTAQIGVDVTAPSDTISGQDVTYTVHYHNDSRVAWNNVELSVKVPRGFLFTKSAPTTAPTGGNTYTAQIGTIESKHEGTLLLTGRLLGEQDEAAQVEATLLITPSNFPSGRFSQSATATTTIASLPMEVKVEAARDVSTGERARLVITVRNLGTNAIPASYLKLTPPPGVQLATTDPEFSPDFSATQKRWMLPAIEPLQEVSKVAIAYVQGRPGDQRPLDIEAGIEEPDPLHSDNTLTFVQRKVSHIFVLATAELFVEQTFNGAKGTAVAKPGDEIKAVIHYQNIGSRGLKDVVISAQLDGTGIDLAKLKLPSGGFDPRTKKITWTAATVPDLKVVQPQQAGDIEFSFNLWPSPAFPTSGDQLKNFTVTSTATIDSPDLSNPVGQTRQVFSDRLVLSVASELTLQAEAFYDDGRIGLKSSGPLPPVAGQQTTYTIRLRLGSSLNDLGDVRLSAILPDGVTYTNKTFMSSGTIQFNNRTGEVVWQIPLMPGGAGRTSPGQEVQFQVAITPGTNQRGQYLPFLNKVKTEATDEFTDTALTAALTTFPTTETASPNKGSVQ